MHKCEEVNTTEKLIIKKASDKTVSGTMQVRISAINYAKIYMLATKAGKQMSAVLNEILNRYIDEVEVEEEE